MLEAIYASWAAKDLESVLSCYSDDVVILVNLPRDVVPYGGETRGKAELELRLLELLRDFEIFDYRPLLIRDVGDTCHAQVRYHYRHKRTGLEIEGTLRHIWHTDGDKIVRLEEIHDSERMRAFFELLATATPKP
jgi:ketosteroid isomerase-like protein